MGEEEDGRPPRPSTSISGTQGYYGNVNPYNLPYMLPPNPYPYPYPHPNPYAWGSQHLPLPPFGTTMSSPLSSNPEELRRCEDTTQALDFVVSEAKKYKIRLILSLSNNWDAYGGKGQYVKWGKAAGLNLT
ncbi:hypothetical protein F2P56_008187 [Juglans regia]|uniref:mannan endo-1,4-beta-mannosidase n=2 Tax=Juglans regia TaxID=51240 RepID=A0A833XU69_JUGRE|nr:probable mannan endo-1,4-beta-mannosidase F isoform X2 [Juglans regia]KAF5471379.1 hypothetical protein F2P56_008187 [Juglans regia]